MENNPFFQFPEVIVDFIFDQGNLFISIKNLSWVAAFRVRIVFDKPMIGLQGQKKISSMRIFRSLDYLAPHKEISIFVDQSQSYFARKQPSIVRFSIQWKDQEGRSYKKNIKHNLLIYKDLGYIVNQKK